MTFSNRELAQRLERAEGVACAQFAEGRRQLFADSGAEWTECAGAYAVYDGVDSPLTQSFGLGVFEQPTDRSMDLLERFFFERGAHADHEVSPLAGVAALDLLCSRGYRPTEISSVLYRPVEAVTAVTQGAITVRVVDADEQQLWSDISANAWSHERPELREFLLTMAAVSFRRAGTIHLLAEIDGRPGATGSLCIHEGVALFAGAATVPELRRRGLQRALLQARMQQALLHGCDLAMMVAEAGSNSQRNAEREGFRIAYTRTKWRLPRP